mmetsp:Transcript_47611/g.136965  ORF Transcript_47611/g.136965 Transcript_47611/m.136965 type:complete len:209 (+) Transcript_47611:418-1044(+)
MGRGRGHYNERGAEAWICAAVAVCGRGAGRGAASVGRHAQLLRILEAHQAAARARHHPPRGAPQLAVPHRQRKRPGARPPAGDLRYGGSGEDQGSPMRPGEHGDKPRLAHLAVEALRGRCVFEHQQRQEEGEANQELPARYLHKAGWQEGSQYRDIHDQTEATGHRYGAGLAAALGAQKPRSGPCRHGKCAGEVWGNLVHGLGKVVRA